MYLVIYTASHWVGYGAQLTTARGAKICHTAASVKQFSRELLDQGFETAWFKWENGATVKLTDEELKIIDTEK
jgi:hypothetical protein